MYSINIWFIAGIIYIIGWVLVSANTVGKTLESNKYKAIDPFIVALFLAVPFILGYLAGLGYLVGSP